MILATVGYVPLRFLVDYFLKKILNHNPQKTKEEIEDNIVSSKKAEKGNILYVFIKKASSSVQYKKFTIFMDSKTGKWVAFFIAVALCTPIVTDVMAVVLLKGKISLKMFLLAGFIAKALVILPLVLLGE